MPRKIIGCVEVFAIIAMRLNRACSTGSVFNQKHRAKQPTKETSSKFEPQTYIRESERPSLTSGSGI